MKWNCVLLLSKIMVPVVVTTDLVSHDDAYFCLTQLWRGFGPPGVAVWETVWNPLTLFSVISAELKVCGNEEKGNLVLVLCRFISSLNPHEMCLQLERWSSIASTKRRNMIVKNLDLWTPMIPISQEKKKGQGLDENLVS